MPPSLTEAVASSKVSRFLTVSYILLFKVESSTPCRRKSRYFFWNKERNRLYQTLPFIHRTGLQEVQVELESKTPAAPLPQVLFQTRNLTDF